THMHARTHKHTHTHTHTQTHTHRHTHTRTHTNTHTHTHTHTHELQKLPGETADDCSVSDGSENRDCVSPPLTSLTALPRGREGSRVPGGPSCVCVCVC